MFPTLKMNQTQVNNFLSCLLQIDDFNYLALHARATSLNSIHDTRLDDTHQPSTHAQSQQAQERLGDRSADDSVDGSSSSDLLIAKVTAMLVLFCASTICGCVPFLLNRYFRWTEKHADARSAAVVKCLLYFGGGVLLSTTFLHLLPEVQDIVEQLQECGILPELTFSLAELLMCGGFFLMYFIEELLHTFVHRHKRLLDSDAGAGAAFERGHSIRNSYLMKGASKLSNNNNNNKESTVPPAVMDNGDVASTIQDGNVINNNNNNSKIVSSASISAQDLLANDLESQKYMEVHERTASHVDVDALQRQQVQQPTQEQRQRQQQYKKNLQQDSIEHHYHHHHHDHHQHHGHSHLPVVGNEGDDMLTASLRGLFIVLALSLHELFEGMAIGLEGDASSVWFMFGAVSAHKLVLAFCVGVELIVARTRTALCIVYILTFAVVSPLGIGIGILISHSQSGSAPTIPSAILQGLACGTLLYVVFFEILSKNHAGLLAYLALFVGFAVMFGLQQLGVEGHGHSHGACSSAHDHDHEHDHHDHDSRSLLLNPYGQLLHTQQVQSENDHHYYPHHHHQHHHQQNDETTPTARDTNFEHELQILREASEKLAQTKN